MSTTTRKLTWVTAVLVVSLFLGCSSSRQSGSQNSELPAARSVQAQPPTERSKPLEQPVLLGGVGISYEVMRPGEYPYTDRMTVEDLVNAAGGLTDFASGIRVVRGGRNLVNVYCGSLSRTRESKFMGTRLEPGDRVWIRRRE
ncbi:MAG: SLBB domain-containing protein [Verrucomicrobia bacterium]|nr:SLBB domain-containing protein [Verrucomicrobiota bacterium]